MRDMVGQIKNAQDVPAFLAELWKRDPEGRTSRLRLDELGEVNVTDA